VVRLAIDFENDCQEWWESGGRDLWECLLEGFDDHDVILEESIAESVLAEAAKLPGWDDGPDYAPHPLCVKAIDEDEEL
jgi:nuclear transport factor 2 (NTF2) superfamily protein